MSLTIDSWRAHGSAKPADGPTRVISVLAAELLGRSMFVLGESGIRWGSRGSTTVFPLLPITFPLQSSSSVLSSSPFLSTWAGTPWSCWAQLSASHSCFCSGAPSQSARACGFTMPYAGGENARSNCYLKYNLLGSSSMASSC